MPNPARASLPLVVYSESLCRGARVLLVGNSRSGIPRALVERGARLVHVCDRNGPRRAEQQAQEAERAITYGSLDDGPAALREGFFDLVLVEDLSAEPEASATLAAVERLLAPRGAALIAAPNPDVVEPLLATSDSVKRLDYYALYDSVIQTLPEVRMLGQVPFVGYALVDFSSESDPSPILDTSLLPPRGEEPDYFVALAGREPRSLEEYAVIQLPLRSVLGSELRAPSEPSAPPPELSKRLARQEAWIGQLEARAEAADLRADQAESELDELKETLGNLRQSEVTARAELATERDALRTENERLRRKINDFDDLLAARKAEIDLLSEQVTARRLEIEHLSAATRTEQAEVKLLAGQIEAITVQSAKSHLEIERLTTALATQNAELERLSSEPNESEEVDRLESQLRNRGERILALERDLAKTERIGRELVQKLGELSAPERSRDLSERLAEAEAELVTLRWSLALARTAPLAARAWAPIS